MSSNDWKNLSSAKNPKFNQQYAELISLFEKHQHSNGKDNDLKANSGMLNAIALFVIERFRTEEEWMNKLSYPLEKHHLHSHEQFAEELSQTIESNSVHNIEKIMNLLEKLIQNHISKDDQSLFRWLDQSHHLENTNIFKVCSFCKKEWQTLDTFLADPFIHFDGYQPDFDHSSRGLLLFTHTDLACCTTMAIEAIRFFSLTPEKIEDLTFKPGIEDCPAHCLSPTSIETCNNMNCKGTQIRRLIKLMLKRKEELLKK